MRKAGLRSEFHQMRGMFKLRDLKSELGIIRLALAQLLDELRDLQAETRDSILVINRSKYQQPETDDTEQQPY